MSKENETNDEMEREVAEVEVALATGDEEEADGDLDEVTVSNAEPTKEDILKDLGIAPHSYEPKDIEEAPTEIDEDDAGNGDQILRSNTSNRRPWCGALALLLCLAICALAVVIPTVFFGNQNQKAGVADADKDSNSNSNNSNNSNSNNGNTADTVLSFSATDEPDLVDVNDTGNAQTTSNFTLVDTMSPYAENDQSLHTTALACPSDGTGWTEVDDDIVGEAAGDFSGGSVAISADGTIVAIGAAKNSNDLTGAAGHVRTFQLTKNGTWVQLGSDIDGLFTGDEFGGSVSLSADGKRMAVGARWNQGTGQTRVFDFDETMGEWTQLGSDILGEASGDQNGRSVALSADGNVLAVGATSNDGVGMEDCGSVRAFKFDGVAWTQLGQDIDGAAARDRTGISVSLSSDGSILAIGAYLNDAMGQVDSGLVRTYTFDNEMALWVPMGQDIQGTAAGDWTGMSVSLSWDGTRVAVGSPGNSDRYLPGVARVYELVNGTTWTVMGETLSNGGYSVSLSQDGTRVAVGDHKDGNSGSESGHASIFEFENNAWVQIGNEIDGQSGELFGTAVALSANGQRVVISGPLYANAYGVTRVFDFC